MEEPSLVPAPKRLLSGVVPLETFLTTLQKVCNHVQQYQDESGYSEGSRFTVAEHLVWIKLFF